MVQLGEPARQRVSTRTGPGEPLVSSRGLHGRDVQKRTATKVCDAFPAWFTATLCGRGRLIKLKTLAPRRGAAGTGCVLWGPEELTVSGGGGPQRSLRLLFAPSPASKRAARDETNRGKRGARWVATCNANGRESANVPHATLETRREPYPPWPWCVDGRSLTFYGMRAAMFAAATRMSAAQSCKSCLPRRVKHDGLEEKRVNWAH